MEITLSSDGSYPQIPQMRDRGRGEKKAEGRRQKAKGETKLNHKDTKDTKQKAKGKKQ